MIMMTDTAAYETCGYDDPGRQSLSFIATDDAGKLRVASGSFDPDPYSGRFRTVSKPRQGPVGLSIKSFPCGYGPKISLCGW